MPDPRRRKKPGGETEEEEKDESGRNKGPSPAIVIVAAAVVLLLIIGGIYFFATSGSDIESIAVGNIDLDIEGISFDLMATPSGIGEYTGDVTFEITLEGRPGALYSEKVRINDGWGYAEVDYTDFVWGNGEYTVSAAAGGKEANNTFRILNVATDLGIEWQGLNSDESMSSPQIQVEVNISYVFGASSRPISAVPQGYQFDGEVQTPDGTKIPISSDDFSPSLIKLQKRFDHDTVGDYVITGSLVNTFCRADSPNRTLQIESNSVFVFDSDPFAMLGPDVTVQLMNGEAVVDFDASGSWDDGTITGYSWDFGDGGAETTTGPTISHTYAEEGIYYVSLLVEDNSGQTSEGQGGTSSSLKVTVTA
ncbi:MAG: PKD domain-containing protein [Thermoplasmatota archaeon]